MNTLNVVYAFRFLNPCFYFNFCFPVVWWLFFLTSKKKDNLIIVLYLVSDFGTTKVTFISTRQIKNYPEVKLTEKRCFTHLILIAGTELELPHETHEPLVFCMVLTKGHDLF